MDLDEPTISDREMAQFHIMAHTRAWVELGQPVEMRVPTLKSFTRMQDPHDRSNPLRGRLRGEDVNVGKGTSLETALGLTSATPLEVLAARVACFINPETIVESADTLAYLLSACIAKIQEEESHEADGSVAPPVLLEVADRILHEFLDLENSFYLAHYMRFAIAQDHIELAHIEQLSFFAKILAEFYTVIHGPLPQSPGEDEQEETQEHETPEEAEPEELEPADSGMTQADAFHMVRLISVLDTRMFVRVATSTGAYPTKHIARPSYANVTRMPLAADARVAQITRANEMIARLANPRLAGIERDTTVQLAGILERTMGAERAKRFCEMSFWAFYDAKDDENADTWEVMRVFIDMEFLCQMGRPFHLEHFRRDIEIISDQEGGRIVFAGGASISFEGMRSLFRPSLGGAI